MPTCIICRFITRNGQKVIETISGGKPPESIAKILQECINGQIKLDDKLSDLDSRVCRKCGEKLLRFYKASLVVKQIRQELLQLMEEKVEVILDTNEETGTELLKHYEHDTKVEEEEIEEEKIQIDEKADAVKQGHDFDDTLIKYECDVSEDAFPCDANMEIVVEELSYIDNVEVIERENVEHEGEFLIEGIETNDNDEVFEEVERLDSDVEYICVKQESKKTKTKSTPKIRQELKCADCELSFKNPRSLRTHQRNVHLSGYICDQCGKILSSYPGFISHCENHDPVKRYGCELCGERFHQKISLNNHMARHSGETPFACDVCSKRFVHKVALYKHKMIHDNQTRKYICNICNFKFRTRAHLNRHMATHTGAKPFHCPICGRSFSQSYNMTVHIKEHEQPGSTRQRRLKCKKCSRTFINKQNFQEHTQRDDCENSGNHIMPPQSLPLLQEQ